MTLKWNRNTRSYELEGVGSINHVPYRSFKKEPDFWPGWWFFLMVIISCLLIFIFTAIPNVHAYPAIDMKIIATIESGNNPLAYNRHSEARGLCQITVECLTDYAWKVVDTDKPKRWVKDNVKRLFEHDFNLKIANWYMNDRIPEMLKIFKIKDTVENRLWAYNAGIGKLKKGIMPQETKNYIKKYKKLG